MCFIITSITFGNLCFKTLSLIDWIVQLCKCIRMLTAHDKQLKTICKTRIFIIFLSERRNFNRMAVNKGRLNQLFFYFLLEEFIKNVTVKHVVTNFYVMFFRG